jgi:hypothetical protein
MNPISLYWQTAKAGTWPAIEAEFRRRAFEQCAKPRPRLERAKNLTALLGHMIEKEEREQ